MPVDLSKWKCGVCSEIYRVWSLGEEEWQREMCVIGERTRGIEPMSVAEMSKGVSADGKGERAEDRASAGTRDREGDRKRPGRASRPPGLGPSGSPTAPPLVLCSLASGPSSVVPPCVPGQSVSSLWFLCLRNANNSKVDLQN